MENNRYIAFDLGKRRIGVSVSDLSGLIARPAGTLIVSGNRDALTKILGAIEEHQPVGIVLGLPLNMSGTSSEISREVESFADTLRERCDIPIFFEDERLTSRIAEDVLHAHGKRIKGNKEKIDRISAALILQSFLDRHGWRQDNV